MVNTWYVAKLKECQEKVNLYEKQVDHFCELRKKNSSMSRGQTYRKLEFGLKELYRMNGYLKNYCMLNKQAIDKILKKHDKNSYFDSRGTVNNAVSHLSFFKQRDLAYQQQRIENLWREVVFFHSYNAVHRRQPQQEDDGPQVHRERAACFQRLPRRTQCRFDARNPA